MSLFRRVVTKGMSRAVLVGPGKRFIFLYHDISDPDAPQHSSLYSTRVERFHEQVEFLSKKFKLVSLDEIVSEESGGADRLASLTFDDGFLSVRDEAYPYLSSKGIPFAVFVNRAAIENNRLFYGAGSPEINRSYDRKVFMDEDDVRYLAGRGVRIGSHSSTHRVLSECGEEELREEILGNKLYVERLVGERVKHLALPFGKREHYDERVLRFCHSVGHDYVYTTNPTYFSRARPAPDRRPIPRVSFLNESREEMLFYINRPLLKRIDI